MRTFNIKSIIGDAFEMFHKMRSHMHVMHVDINFQQVRQESTQDKYPSLSLSLSPWFILRNFGNELLTHSTHLQFYEKHSCIFKLRGMIPWLSCCCLGNLRALDSWCSIYKKTWTYCIYLHIGLKKSVPTVNDKSHSAQKKLIYM